MPIDWEDVDVTPVKGPDGRFRLPQKIFESMARTKVGLKGPLATPIGKGHQSLNLALRKYVHCGNCLKISFESGRSRGKSVLCKRF